MVSNSNNVKTLCPLHPPLRLKACPQMVPLPLLAGLQATPLNRLLKILDTLNNPFSRNRNVLSFFCVCGHWTFAFCFPFKWAGGDVTSLVRGKLYRLYTSQLVIQRSPFFHHSESYLEACVGHRMAEVVESPWLRGGVNRFPLDIKGHTISPRKLEYSHGDGTLLPGNREKCIEGCLKWKIWKKGINKCVRGACWSNHSYLIIGKTKQNSALRLYRGTLVLWAKC